MSSLAETGTELRVPEPKAIARTYSPRNYDDPWELVQDYHRALDIAADQPDLGTTAIAREADLPRGRIRPWLENDVVPDPVRAIQLAEDRGWIVSEDDLSRSRGTGLTTLATWIFAGGSINRNFTPQFVCSSNRHEESLARLYNAGQWLGIVFRRTDRTMERTDEYVPTEQPAVLGRVLHAAGAPLGSKTDTTLSLPEWIVDGPANIRGAAAATYIGERMTPSGQGRVFQQRSESRSDAFLNEVGELLTDVLGGEYVVGNQHLRLDVTASRNAEQLLERYAYGDLVAPTG